MSRRSGVDFVYSSTNASGRARLLADHGLDAGPGYRAGGDEVDAHPERSELDGEAPHPPAKALLLAA